ncbi:NADP-dependent oxidoreductase [Phenylobacterium sp.]|uniref:NADP-dependent oxidoreductase n=1 Tax=Phenylobacterium sp. TaxID=1871053 RepID=UPI0012268DD5|nr:NADP-dependent oxidoreductase [Phenylobacterium sp.]THD58294.1 MAG: NADP-dependent oxidoreductase [Phenylobacterium sp.]
MPKSREVHLVHRPSGAPKPEDFALVDRQVPDAGEGEVLVQNLLMSVDPAMRPRLTAGQALDEAMMGGALGRVVQSRTDAFAVGDLVTNRNGFREYFVSDGKGLTKLAPDPDLPLSVYMHALGGTGFTAYGGLLHIGQLKDGEQVFVSTAAGAVGSVAAQIAKLKGCYVVGSTGADDKAAWLRDTVGLDAVINYKTQPIRQALEEATPKGIDVYFDNVGGDHLEAALRRMNTLGRVPVCGFISGYNSGHSTVSNLSNIIYARVMLRGFVAPDFMHLYGDFQRDMAGWLKSGQVKHQETVRDGIAEAPAALIGLMAGENSGKMLVRLAD